MATKVGGLFISLALDMAQFDEGMDSAADKTKRMEKFQGDLESAVGKSDRSAGRLAERMLQLSGAGSQYNSAIIALIKSYEHYEASLVRVYNASGIAVTGIVKTQAAMAALNATAKAFAPILAFDLLARSAEWAGGKIGELTNEWERFVSSPTVQMEMQAKEYRDRIADIRNELKTLRKEEITESEIINSKSLNLKGKLVELGKLLEKEKNKTIARDTEERIKKEKELREQLANEWVTTQIGLLDGIEQEEAKINLKYDQRLIKARELSDANERRLESYAIGEQRVAELENARYNASQNAMKAQAEASQSVFASAEKWAKAALESVTRFASVVQGIGNEEEARWGSRMDSVVRNPTMPSKASIESGARDILSTNPKAAAAGWNVDEVARILREMLDIQKQVTAL